MTKVIEIVEFKLNSGVADAAALAAAQKTVEFVKEQDGFIRRSLNKNPDGVWVDVVEWQDMASAEAAGGKFMTDSRNAEFGSMIDGPSVRMLHLDNQMSC